jgi:hypothetical protein
MKRSIFLLIVAILSLFIGFVLLFAPSMAIEGNGFVSSDALIYVFRLLGGLVISKGVLNFLVRNDEDSNSLKAVLLFNVLNHFLSTCIDIKNIFDSVSTFSSEIPFLVIHLFVIIGSAWYLSKMGQKT